MANFAAPDSLAQQVEHNTFNVGVLGSSPRRITKNGWSYFDQPFLCLANLFWCCGAAPFICAKVFWRTSLKTTGQFLEHWCFQMNHLRMPRTFDALNYTTNG